MYLTELVLIETLCDDPKLKADQLILLVCIIVLNCVAASN